MSVMFDPKLVSQCLAQVKKRCPEQWRADEWKLGRRQRWNRLGSRAVSAASIVLVGLVGLFWPHIFFTPHGDEVAAAMALITFQAWAFCWLLWRTMFQFGIPALNPFVYVPVGREFVAEYLRSRFRRRAWWYAFAMLVVCFLVSGSHFLQAANWQWWEPLAATLLLAAINLSLSYAFDALPGRLRVGFVMVMVTAVALPLGAVFVREGLRETLLAPGPQLAEWLPQEQMLRWATGVGELPPYQKVICLLSIIACGWIIYRHVIQLTLNVDEGLDQERWTAESAAVAEERQRAADEDYEDPPNHAVPEARIAEEIRDELAVLRAPDAIWPSLASSTRVEAMWHGVAFFLAALTPMLRELTQKLMPAQSDGVVVIGLGWVAWIYLSKMPEKDRWRAILGFRVYWLNVLPLDPVPLLKELRSWTHELLRLRLLRAAWLIAGVAVGWFAAIQSGLIQATERQLWWQMPAAFAVMLLALIGFMTLNALDNARAALRLYHSPVRSFRSWPPRFFLICALLMGIPILVVCILPIVDRNSEFSFLLVAILLLMLWAFYSLFWICLRRQMLSSWYDIGAPRNTGG
jgi:hypothetical protein